MARLMIALWLLGTQGAFHVDPTPEIFVRILLLRQNWAN